MYVYICENKGADQLCSNCEQFLYFQILNFQSLAIFCSCTAGFVSDLFGNHIVGFLVLRLICDIMVKPHNDMPWNPGNMA